MLKLSALKPEVCRYCRQDILRDCTPESRAAGEQSCPVATIAKLSRVAEQAGLGRQELVQMLEGGMSLRELGRIVLACLEAAAGEGTQPGRASVGRS